MNDKQDRTSDRNDLARGLPMFTASAPEVIAEEKVCQSLYYRLAQFHRLKLLLRIG